MNWTPESLARGFHESYGRAAAKAYGHGKEPEPWDSLPEQSKALMIAACADLLGVEQPQAVVEATKVEVSGPVPTREEFRRAAMNTPEHAPVESLSDESSDWYADLRKDIESITAPQIRHAHGREPFRK